MAHWVGFPQQVVSLGYVNQTSKRLCFLSLSPAVLTDFNLYCLDQDVAKPVKPTEGLSSANLDLGELHAEVHAMDEISVTGNSASNFLAPVTRTIDTIT